jgi:hypothetical protein
MENRKSALKKHLLDNMLQVKSEKLIAPSQLYCSTEKNEPLEPLSSGFMSN